MLRRSVAAAPAMWSTSDGKEPTTISRPGNRADSGASESEARQREHRHVDRDVGRRTPARVGGHQADVVADAQQGDGLRIGHADRQGHTSGVASHEGGRDQSDVGHRLPGPDRRGQGAAHRIGSPSPAEPPPPGSGA